VIDPALALVVRLGGALLLLGAAGHKLRDRERFRAALAGHRLLPERSVRLAAALLVALEIGLGLGLLAAPAVAVGAAGLLAVYAGAIGVNLARGRRHIDCGCGGSPQGLSGWLVARNLLVATALAACAAPSNGRGLVLLDGVSIGAGVAVLALLWAAMDVAIANGGRAWATR
jgi:hypothetical protein